MGLSPSRDGINIVTCTKAFGVGYPQAKGRDAAESGEERYAAGSLFADVVCGSPNYTRLARSRGG
jgi:hypothetical protein